MSGCKERKWTNWDSGWQNYMKSGEDWSILMLGVHTPSKFMDSVSDVAHIFITVLFLACTSTQIKTIHSSFTFISISITVYSFCNLCWIKLFANFSFRYATPCCLMTSKLSRRCQRPLCGKWDGDSWRDGLTSKRCVRPAIHFHPSCNRYHNISLTWSKCFSCCLFQVLVNFNRSQKNKAV